MTATAFTIFEAFGVWTQAYQNLTRTGFTPYQDSRGDAIRKIIARNRMVRTGLFSAAGLIALAAVIGYAAMRPGG